MLAVADREHAGSSSTDLTKMYLARLKRYGDPLHCVVTLTEDLALAQAADADKEIEGRHAIAGRCTASRGARRISSTPKASGRRGAPSRTRTACPTSTRRSSSGCATRARCCARSCRWARSRRAASGSAASTRNPWAPDNELERIVGRPGRGDRGRPRRASRSAPRRAARSSRRRRTCGVVGLRPTYGRVSRYGAMALSWTMDKIGPMCRSVEDCAIVFNAIYGSDGRDETVVDAPFNWNPDVPLSSLKIGYVESEFDATERRRRRRRARRRESGGRAAPRRGAQQAAEGRARRAARAPARSSSR